MRNVLFAGAVLVAGACGPGLNQTSITCPAGRTLLDGVCVAEAVADYVACVRAQGAQLDASKGQAVSAEAGYLGARASGAAEISETLAKKYSASDAAMMAIIAQCDGRTKIARTAAQQPPPASGEACTRPGQWCTHAGAVFQLVDVDGDGIADPTCSDGAGNAGAMRSKHGCVDTWPGGFGAPVCSRTSNWCTHGGSTFQLKDVDGDAVPDPTCSDTSGNAGALWSTKGCADSWPAGF